MRKNLLLLICLLHLLHIASAQENNRTVKRFGFRTGVNLFHMDFSKSVPPATTKTSWNAGVSFGFLLTVPVTDKISFQPEYLFAGANSKVKNSDTSYKLNYLSLPLLLRVQLLKKLSVVAGPQFDLLINAKRIIRGSASNITHDTEERNIAGTAGIEYYITEYLSLCSRYTYGFNHIGIGQRSDVREFNFNMLQASVCVRFG